MALHSECLILKEEGEASWVEAELERELADIAHLTLQDLEEEVEEEHGFHGNKEVPEMLALCQHNRSRIGKCGNRKVVVHCHKSDHFIGQGLVNESME